MPQLRNHHRKRSRPRTDYERWLEDHAQYYQPTGNAQYHLPILNTDEDVRPLDGGQESLLQKPDRSTHSNSAHYHPADRPHGYFVTGPSLRTAELTLRHYRQASRPNDRECLPSDAEKGVLA
ncbi:hypothetical protein BDV39DRAFT_208533 [Aspergillus sergii]|uniref:Uncharacterized protein n=1 Tax=Aspergillus sergii TaxID=1034303 RepID=A0A5N6WST8_9EURO|nr:hypothetical protein BDV39DRAFT_208533 [Aspergillus sergii]